MTHLMLTSALLLALLAMVAIVIGAGLGIARDVLLEGGIVDEEDYWTPDNRDSIPDERAQAADDKRSGEENPGSLGSGRLGSGTRGRDGLGAGGLGEDFRVGLRHAALGHSRGGPFRGSRSRHP